MSESRERTITVSVTVVLPEVMGTADARRVAAAVGGIREALESSSRFTVDHSGLLVGIVGESLDPNDTYRTALRLAGAPRD